MMARVQGRVPRHPHREEFKAAFYCGWVKVAAYQSPLLPEGSFEAVKLIRERVRECEKQGVSVLCCPEAILGGLADYTEDPSRIAIRTDGGQLQSVLMPLASDTVTLIIGFTELSCDGALYNAAAVFQRGQVAGVYRKIHPALRRSVYRAGAETPVFWANGLTFGIVICNDSNYPLARRMAEAGATVIFIPTNNGLPNARGSEEMRAATRTADLKLATESRCWAIRADVAGRNGILTGFGSSEIVDPFGNIVCEAQLGQPDLLVADIDV
jgi:5-aminopentanamidase